MVPYNKHWPSMFRRSNYQDSQPVIKSSPTGGHAEERTSQPPKPRWLPTPQQVQILETIFNSGMMNPPRTQIKKLREQLQEFGPIAEINIFYWFQNRKSRMKRKQTQPKNMNPRKTKTSQNASSSLSLSLSSSSHQNASSNEIVVPNNIELPSDNDDFPNDTIFGDQNLATDLLFDIPIETDFQLPTSPLFSFPSQFSNMTHQLPQNEMFMNIQDHENAMSMIQQQQQQQTSNSLDDDSALPPIITNAPVGDPFSITQFQGVGQPALPPALPPTSSGLTSNSLDDDSALPPLPPIIVDALVTDPFSITQFQGVGEPDHFKAKCTVSINNVIVEVDAGPFNVRQIFGDGVVLVDSFGLLVLTDEWGVTLDSLKHGASYYLHSTNRL